MSLSYSQVTHLLIRKRTWVWVSPVRPDRNLEAECLSVSTKDGVFQNVSSQGPKMSLQRVTLKGLCETSSLCRYCWRFKY